MVLMELILPGSFSSLQYNCDRFLFRIPFQSVSLSVPYAEVGGRKTEDDLYGLQ